MNLIRLRCWWFGCEECPASYSGCCRYCDEIISYGDLVGDTRHNRAKAWAEHWFWRKWWPEKCPDCGGRWRHDETKAHIPF